MRFRGRLPLAALCLAGLSPLTAAEAPKDTAAARVTDLALLKAQASAFSNSALVKDFIGSGARKQNQLIVHPKLEHRLADGEVRADLLRRSILRSAHLP